MYRMRLAASVAAVALATRLMAPGVAMAQTTATSSTFSESAVQDGVPAKRSAAERRQAKRKKRQQRVEALKVKDEQNRASRVAAASKIDGSSEQDVVVTGTRISSNYGKTGSPVQTLGKEELRRRGLAHIEDALNALPAVKTSLGNLTASQWNDPGDFGRSPVDLRGLGSSRTLVLINGQRATNDTNSIPPAMIERVEVLTGGASAVYGSDAVGGVVNYILKRNYTGFTIDGEGTLFQHTNNDQAVRQLLADNKYSLPPKNFIGGPQGYINATTGRNFAGNRGNITARIGYRVTSNLNMNKFDTTSCRILGGPAPGTPPGGFNDHSVKFCGNPGGYNPYGNFNIIPFVGDGSNLTRKDGDPYEKDTSEGSVVGGRFSNAIDGSKRFRPYSTTDTQYVTGQDYLYRHDTNLNWGVNARYKIDENNETEINGSLSHTDYRTGSKTTNIDSIEYGGVRINCDNPFLSAQQATAICGVKAGDPKSYGQIDVEYVPANAERDYRFHMAETYITGQFKGKLTKDIRYELNLVRNDHRDTSTFNTYYDGRRLVDGLRARLVNGKIVCLPSQEPVVVADDPSRTAANKAIDAECQPIDIFSTKGPSQAAYDYLTKNPGSSTYHTISTNFNQTISGNLGALGIHSPFATGPLGFSLYYEHREDKFRKTSDGSLSWDQPYHSLYKETDLAGEFALPLIQDKPFAKYVQASGAYRRMFFPGGASASTWRLGGDYNVADGFSFRGSYSKAYRVDAFGTYSPQNLNAGNDPPYLTDLCSPPGGINPTARRLSFEQCAKAGVTRQQYDALSSRTDCNEAGQCPTYFLSGGNPNLKPEISNTVTAGITFAPKFLRNFDVSVDWYRFKINGFIGGIDPFISFNNCVAGVSFYCIVYHRDPATGRLNVPGAYADSRVYNLGDQQNQGIDIRSNYRFDLQNVAGHDLGSIAFNFEGNIRLKNLTSVIPGKPAYDCTGYWGYVPGKTNCGDPDPGWKHTLRTIWVIPWSQLAVNLFWRYQAKVKYAGLSNDPSVRADDINVDLGISKNDMILRASSYFDAGLNMSVGKLSSIRLNVTNILDTKPRIIDTERGGWFNTYPTYYDPLGRRITFGFSTSF